MAAVTKALGDLRSERVQLANLSTETMEELQHLQKQLIGLQAELDTELDSLASERQTLEQQQQEFTRHAATAQELTNQVSSLQSELSNARDQLQEADRRRSADADEQTRQLNAAYAELKDAQEKLQEYQQREQQSADEVERQTHSVRVELDACRWQLEQTRRERDAAQGQLAEVVDDMTAMSGLLALVRETHDEFQSAQAHSSKTESQLREELENRYRNEYETLTQRCQELEHLLLQARQAAQQSASELQERNQELDSHRVRWAAELDRVQNLLDVRAQLLGGELAAVAVPAKKQVNPSSVPSPTAVDSSPPAVEPASSPEPSISQQADCRDPVIGSVLAEFERLGGKKA